MRNLKYVLALFLLAPAALPAQSNQPSLETRLIGKPLYLRGMWSADTLHFDGTGALIGPSETTSFTLAGVDIKRVQLNGNGLVLDGRRMGLELEQKDAQSRVPLQVDGDDERMHIEIALAPGADYNRALDAIFSDGVGSLVPALPDFWKLYATNNFLAPGSNQPLHDPKQVKALDKPISKGGKESIVKPTLARSVGPQITPAANTLGYKATVIISLIVEKDGVPSHLQILRPAGLGLDEQAIAAVRQYIFNPATQKGRPVPVDLNIEVNFNGGSR